MQYLICLFLRPSATVFAKQMVFDSNEDTRAQRIPIFSNEASALIGGMVTLANVVNVTKISVGIE